MTFQDPLSLPFVKILHEAQAIRISDAFSRMMTYGACALTMGQQEDLYLQTIKGLNKHDLDVIVRAYHQLVEDMEQHPYTDLLGPVYMELGNDTDKSRRGEFFTPQALNQVLTQMVFDRSSFPDDAPLTFSEPSCGTGGMVLAAAEHCVTLGISPLHTSWVLMDLSPSSCYGAFINTTLWGIPATVICGNTLSLEVNWQWRNIHWESARPLVSSPFKRLLDVIKSLPQAKAPQSSLSIQPPLF